MRKVEWCVVTGAVGFIGFNLCKRLISEGTPIIALDNINEYYDPELKKARLRELKKSASAVNSPNSSFVFELVDLRDLKSLEIVFKKYKINKICHLAAQAGVRYSLDFPEEYVSNNILATLNLLKMSKSYSVNDIIFASTSSVYGLSENIPFNENEPIDSTITAYSATKRACELLLRSYNHLFSIRVRILRFFTVYGPWGRPDMALFLFTKAILKGEPIEVYNHGNMSRDFTYIDDIVDGFIRAINTPLDFEIINLGSGRRVELMKYIEIM